MTHGTFLHFVQLIEFDKQTHTIAQHKESLTTQLAALQTTLESLALTFEKAQQEYKKKSLAVKEIEAQLELLDDQQRSKEKRLDAVNSSKEYLSLQHEIDSLKHAQHLLEPEIQDAWNKHATEKKNVEIVQQKNNEAIASFQEQCNSINATLLQADHDLNQRLVEREALLPLVPVELLEKYEGLKHRLSDPIVPLEGNNCSQCHHIVPAQKINRILAQSLEQCTNCFRFLYCSRNV